MTRPKILLGIAFIEILIGAITFCAVMASLALATNTKTLNVLVFVIITSLLSFSLGIGILRLNITAYRLLIYFSSVVLLTKLLLFFGIIYLNGTLETTVPVHFKNIISVLYHGFIVIYLANNRVQKIFIK
ncbi:MAG: hypothetical protein WC676_02575 [Candidatus Omnitrophota bacterium]